MIRRSLLCAGLLVVLLILPWSVARAVNGCTTCKDGYVFAIVRSSCEEVIAVAQTICTGRGGIIVLKCPLAQGDNCPGRQPNLEPGLPTIDLPVLHSANQSPLVQQHLRGFSITMRQSGRLRVSLCDVAGRVMGVVFDGELTEGTHELALNAVPSITPGVYFAKFQVGAAYAVKKLVVLR